MQKEQPHETVKQKIKIPTLNGYDMAFGYPILHDADKDDHE